uniref:Uncharacterized protein n=1 Tax=Cyanophora sudae TaxID=1522369 RepID=A0A873WVD3_9EUKA|nr:hypothetical protein DXZ12_mgp37 [Cyanophora sudae]QPB15069.1 hypothetical protein [Cyanophora sudae]
MPKKTFFFILFFLIILQIFIFAGFIIILQKTPLCLSIITCFIINIFRALFYCEKKNIIFFYKKGHYIYNKNQVCNIVLYTKKYYGFSIVLLDSFSAMINYTRILFWMLFFFIGGYIGYSYNLFPFI